ncbi:MULTISPECIES: hypothetical protein [unclassified Lentimonas]|uniref:hypothetical protein n=1 Tax=unclassified Lentimonas TaxID=2630993 RepID=UPI0013898F42|nr:MULTISPECIES: hypothetical protein [unclassified Lentimonas]
MNMKILCLYCMMSILGLTQMVAQPTYSQMEEGDRIQLTFESTGCFHYQHDVYIFSRADGAVEVTLTTSEEFNAESESAPLRGPIQLSAEQVKVLDEELRFIRKAHPSTKSQVQDNVLIIRRGGMSASTTSSSLRIEFIEGDQLICDEAFQNPMLASSSSSFGSLKKTLLATQ